MTLTSVIGQAKLQMPRPLRAPCGHLHCLDGSTLVGSTFGQLVYVGRFRCKGSLTHVYTRKD